MAFCSQCGAAIQPGMGFCVACGATLPAPVAVASAPGAPAVPARPVGKRVAPWKTVVLPIVTLGVYIYVFWWRIAREMDAYADARASPLVRAGILVIVLGFALGLVSTAAIVMPFVATAIEDPASMPDAEILQEMLLASPAYLAGIGLGFAGDLILWAGLWRAWKAIEADERRRAVAMPLRPGLLLAFLALGPILQLVSFAWPPAGGVAIAPLVALLWVIQHTQSRLNATWVASGAPVGGT